MVSLRLSCPTLLSVLTAAAYGQELLLTDHGSCVEGVLDPVPDLEAGEVRVFPQGAHPDSLVFEVLGTSCGTTGTYEFFLNDLSLGTVPANPTCSLRPPLQTFVVTDPGLLSAWNPGGENRLRFNLRGGTWAGWVRATLLHAGRSTRVCVWDHDGGNCDDPDLSSATYSTGQGVLDEEVSFPDFVLVPEVVVPFEGGRLPEVDLSGLPPGDHVLAVNGGLSMPLSLTLDILSTQCSFGDTFDFSLNDLPLTPAPVVPLALELCSCQPTVQTVRITDPAVLAAWNPAGPNELRFVKTDATSAVGNSTAWVRATVEGSTDTLSVTVFDAKGGNGDATDLCVGGFIANGIDTTATVGALGQVPTDLQAPFTLAGQQSILFDGSCVEPEPDPDPDPDPDPEPDPLALGDPQVLWPPDGRLRDVSSLLAAVPPPASVSVFSNVPEDRRRFLDFVQTGSRILLRAEKGHARGGRYYLMVVDFDDGSQASGVAAVVPPSCDRRSAQRLLEEAAAALEVLRDALAAGGNLPAGLYPLGPQERPAPGKGPSCPGRHGGPPERHGSSRHRR